MRLNRAPILAGFSGVGSSMNTHHSIWIAGEGLDEKVVKGMALDVDEAVSLDELEQLAKDYIDRLPAKAVPIDGVA